MVFGGFFLLLVGLVWFGFEMVFSWFNLVLVCFVLAWFVCLFVCEIGLVLTVWQHFLG